MPSQEMTLLSDFDLHLFNEGRHYRLYEKLGAHPVKVAGVTGTYFAVWAPNANYVSVIGDFNGWNTGSHQLQPRAQSGIWEGFIPGVGKGAVYKFHIGSHNRGYRVDKVDPFGLYSLPPPETGSMVWDLDYAWADRDWMAKRPQNNGLHAPMAIYEVHLGSWKRVPEEGHRSLTYRELAEKLPEYVKRMGFSHVEFMPIMEHPFYGSWGYQVVGYFRADEPLRHAAGPDDAH